MTTPVTPNGSGDCPPESQARAKGNSLNERNQASPTIERSRLGPVRELRLPVVVEERQTHYAERKTPPHDGDCSLW